MTYKEGEYFPGTDCGNTLFPYTKGKEDYHENPRS